MCLPAAHRVGTNAHGTGRQGPKKIAELGLAQAGGGRKVGRRTFLPSLVEVADTAALLSFKPPVGPPSPNLASATKALPALNPRTAGLCVSAPSIPVRP